MYKYIHTCIYIHIYMSAHIHTYTYIHTHIQNVYINTRKHAWNDGAAANVQGAVADQGSFAILFCSTQSTHISHLQCKDFIVPTSCSTNTPAIFPRHFPAVSMQVSILSALQLTCPPVNRCDEPSSPAAASCLPCSSQASARCLSQWVC